MNFPFRHFFVAVVAAFGIFSAVNLDTYHADVVTICDQVTTNDFRTPEERHAHLPECPLPQIAIRKASQVVATPRPAAPGEDASTAQLLPEDRIIVDRDRFVEGEGIAGFLSGLVIVVKRGVDAGAREKAEQERAEREQREQREREERMAREQREFMERVEREERRRQERERGEK